MSFFLFRDYYLVAIMLYREYPEKSFKSFSLLANALPIGIPAEGLDLGILQPEIGILQPDWYSSDSWGIGFPEGYFSAETFQPLAEGFLNPILQPECPRVGRLRAG